MLVRFGTADVIFVVEKIITIYPCSMTIDKKEILAVTMSKPSVIVPEDIPGNHSVKVGVVNGPGVSAVTGDKDMKRHTLECRGFTVGQ